MAKKKILLDIDEVVCFCGILQAVNDFMGTNYSIDDFTDYYIDEVAVPKEYFNDFNEFLSHRNLYEEPDLLPKAIETLERLNEHFDIYVCSSCLNSLDLENSGRIFQDKFNFLRTFLPFLDPKKFIFTSSKHIFKADIQVDDRLGNLDPEIETKILFPSYHNKDITDEELKEKGILRAGYEWRTGWEELEKILMGLLVKEETSMSYTKAQQ